MTITAEEAQVRSLDIFATTDGKPIFFKFNISLWAVWLIILSFATGQDFCLKLYCLQGCAFFMDGKNDISLLLLLIRLLAQSLGFGQVRLGVGMNACDGTVG